MLRLSVPRVNGSLWSFEAGKHYYQADYECHLRLVSVFSQSSKAFGMLHCQEFKTSQLSSQTSAYFYLFIYF